MICAGAALASNATLWALVAIAVAGLAALGIYARFVEPFRLRVTRWEITPLLDPALNGKTLRVVFFSDMHLGQFKQAAWARKIVELVNAQQPDLVLIGGDFAGRVDGRDLAEMFAPLADLRARFGVFGVLGNHDCGVPGPDLSSELLTLLPRYGVRMLRNEGVRLAPGARLLGLDELWAGGSDFGAAARACPDDGGLTLVLGHNPDALDLIEPAEATVPAHTVFLFGHTHGGQIRVPFFPGAAIPIRGVLYRGAFKQPQGAVYVSCGLGENTSPTRLGAPPEIVVFDAPCYCA
jgi:hypothetical protein